MLYVTCTPWPSTDGQIHLGKLTISCSKVVEHTAETKKILYRLMTIFIHRIKGLFR